MFTKEKRYYIYLLMVLILFGTGCGNSVEAVSMNSEDITAIDENELLYITDIDLTTEYTEPEYIDLNQSDEEVLIGNGGEYVLTGEGNQTVTIDAHDELVHLILNNASIATAVGPAINVESAGKVVITLPEGTMNTLFDAAYYKNEDLDASIMANCDLTVNGPGTLYVCGYYKDAIHTKDVFKVLGSTLQLKAKRYGIRANDGMVIEPEYLLIESEKNGCQTTNANKEGKGIIDIRGGEISIVSGQYALSAVADIYIREGAVYLNSVVGDIYTEGRQYIAEGVLADE